MSMPIYSHNLVYRSASKKEKLVVLKPVKERKLSSYELFRQLLEDELDKKYANGSYVSLCNRDDDLVILYLGYAADVF